MKTTVHCVAWEYSYSGEPHGGGFYWYPDPHHADESFEGEKKNADDWQEDSKWEVVRFDVEVEATERQAITDEIEAQLTDLFDKAEQRYTPEK